jgi:hypothetical protein
MRRRQGSAESHRRVKLAKKRADITAELSSLSKITLCVKTIEPRIDCLAQPLDLVSNQINVPIGVAPVTLCVAVDIELSLGTADKNARIFELTYSP